VKSFLKKFPECPDMAKVKSLHNCSRKLIIIRFPVIRTSYRTLRICSRT
jgi:hypothetical protein